MADPKQDTTTATLAVQRGRALVDRANRTTGYWTYNANNPPPSIQELIEAIGALCDAIEGAQAGGFSNSA